MHKFNINSKMTCSPLMKSSHRYSLILCLGMSSSAYCGESYEIKLFAQSAKISGYMQTPKGGTLGSSSPKRPSFSEMDKKSNINGDLQLSKRYDGMQYYLGYHCNPINKTVNLKQSLTTHNQVIPAGTSVNFKMRFNWARFGVAQDLCHCSSSKILTEIAYLKNYYEFSSISNRSKRTFGGINFRLGYEHQTAINKETQLNLYVNSSVPKITNAQIRNLGFELTHKGWLAHYHITPLVGLGYSYIRHKDSQPLPNDVLYKGLQARAGLLLAL